MPDTSAALGATELTRLASDDHQVPFWLSVLSFTEVANCLVNGAPTADPLRIITVDTWTNLANVTTDMIAKIYNGSTIRCWVRVRSASATQLVIGEVSRADTGLFPLASGVGAIQDNDTISIAEFPIPSTRPPLVQNGSLFMDGDQSVGLKVSAPEPIVTIADRHEMVYLTGGATTVARTKTATVTKWPPSISGGSTLGYQWTYPAGFTGVSGATTASLTFTAPVGSHFFYLVVTDTVGGATEKLGCWLRVHNAADPPLECTAPNDNRDLNSRRVTVLVKKANLATVTPGVMVMLASVPTYGGLTVDTAVTTFVGFIKSRPFQASPGDVNWQIEIVGVMDILDNLTGFAHTFEKSAGLVDWDELYSDLCTFHFVTWFILRWHCANVLRWFNFTPITTSNLSGRLKTWNIEPGKVGEQLKALAAKYDCNIGSKSDGEIKIRRIPALTNTADKAALTKRATLNYSQWSDIDVKLRDRPDTGLVRLEGYHSDLVTDTKVAAKWPGEKMGEGGGDFRQDDMLFESALDSRERAAAWGRRLNRPYETITITFRGKNWDVAEPPDGVLYDVVVPASVMPTGIETTLTCFALGVPKTPLGGQRTDIQIEFEPLAVADDSLDAIDDPIPTEDTNIYNPAIGTPPISTPPILPGVVPTVVSRAGQPDAETRKAVLYNTATDAYRIYNITPSSPTCEEITPSGVTNVEQIDFDTSSDFSRVAYCLTNDGTDSVLYYTSDVFATSVTWLEKATIAGIWTKFITYKGAPGVVEIYNPDTTGSSGATTLSYDFSGGEQGWSVWNDGADNRAIFNAGSGYSDYFVGGANDSIIIESPTYSSVNFTNITIRFNPSWTGSNPLIRVRDAANTTTHGSSTSTGAEVSITVNFTDTGFLIIADPADGSFEDSTCVITGVEVSATTDPTASTGNAAVRYSTDYGATFSVEVTVGTSPGASGGFDGVHIGRISLAAKDQQVTKRTALGGNYANEANGATVSTNPICILYPWFDIGSISLTNNDGVDYIFATAAFVGGEALWKVHNGIKTAITPDVGGTKAVGVSDCCISVWKGKHIIFIGDVSGTRYVFVSKDTGATWTNTAMTGAVSVRCRRQDPSGNDWIVAVGSNDLRVSTDGGLTWSTKTVTGDPIFATWMG